MYALRVDREEETGGRARWRRPGVNSLATSVSLDPISR
jgi:hypothetical protein